MVKKSIFFLSAGLKSLIDSLFEIPIRPVLTGYLQKGIKKYHYLPLVHRPGNKELNLKKTFKKFLQFFISFLNMHLETKRKLLNIFSK